MKTYTGSCHCGAVRFEIETDLTSAVDCNCSICTKKGALHHRVPPERFKLLSGGEALGLYQFGTKTAKHWFCQYCGIHAFSNPRSAPELYSINVRCLDNLDLGEAGLEVRVFDGRNYEQALEELRSKKPE